MSKGLAHKLLINSPEDLNQYRNRFLGQELNIEVIISFEKQL